MNNSPSPAISVQDVRLGYGTQTVLSDVSFEVAAGSICAIIGPNGSGKTTLLRALLGLLPPQSGEILLFGRHPHDTVQNVGYVPQRFAFDANVPITVHEFLDLALRKPCVTGCAEQKLADVGLEPVVMDQLLGTLSGGQLQRVLIAQAILNEPSLLFLDEPSTGVDVVGERAIFDVIEHLRREHGTTVVLVSHDVAMVGDLVDQVVCVNRRLLCVGPPRTALTERKLSELYGRHMHAFEHRHGHAHDKSHHRGTP